MNVLHISSAKIMGGGEVYTTTLCQNLASKNINIFLCCRKNTPLCSSAKERGIKTINLNLASSIDIISIIKLAIFCKKNKIDIIHANLSKDYWVAYFVKMLCPKIKIVATYHVDTPIKNKPQYKELYKKIDKVIAVSNAVKKCICASSAIDETKVIAIHNGTEITKLTSVQKGYFRKQFNIPEHQILIGNIGRINIEKAQHIFIESIPEVIKHFPEAKFVIVGKIDTKDAYTQNLQELVKELNIENNVIFTGFQQNVAEIMKDLDIFVHTAKNEAFGLVIAEAMACAVPTIATNTGGIPEIIKHRENGFLTPPNDSKALSGAIIEVLKDTELRSKMASQGQKTIVENFEIGVMADNVIDLYKSILP